MNGDAASSGGVRTMRAPLSRDPRSAGDARHLITTVVSGTACEPTGETAELLVSELVGNAVRYGREPVELDICCAGDRLEVGVKDAGAGAPRLKTRDCVGTDDGDLPEGGRGLWLVEELAAIWGSDRTRGGKRIWFVLIAG